jgi:GNAT superfamily N-acetyltransferase
VLDALAPLGVNDIAMPATPFAIWQAIEEAEIAPSPPLWPRSPRQDGACFFPGGMGGENMAEAPGSLLDQITLVHGPREMLRRYFLLAEAALAERGIRLRLRTDFAALVEINHQHRDSWPGFIPMFDPAHNALRIDDSFWIEGVDGSGCPVVTHAGRLYDWDDTTLEAELTSLRAFFRDPAPHLARGDFIRALAPSARQLGGRIMGDGAVWVRPDHRGKGLATLVPRVSRAYALTRWNIDALWAVMEPRIRDQGLADRHGFHEEEMIVFQLKAWRDHLPMLLVWLTREEAFAHIAAAVDRGHIEEAAAAVALARPA